MRFGSSKSHDKSHPIIGNGTIEIAATHVAATLKKVPALLFANSIATFIYFS